MLSERPENERFENESFSLIKEGNTIKISQHGNVLEIIELKIPQGMKLELVNNEVRLSQIDERVFHLKGRLMDKPAEYILAYPSCKTPRGISWHFETKTLMSGFNNLNEFMHQQMHRACLFVAHQDPEGKNQFGQTLYRSIAGDSYIFLNPNTQEFVPGNVWHYTTMLEKLESNMLTILEPASASQQNPDDKELERKLQRWELPLDHKKREYLVRALGTPFKK